MKLDAALDLLARDPVAPLDVAELALYLAQDEYPALDVEAYLAELDGMAREARNYLGGSLEARVKGLCRYLFHEMGFHGNTRDYYDPLNSYLNQVIDRRTGLPITLTVMAMAVGARVGLEVAGVGLPGHFVAKAVENGREVIFDPFHGGRALTPEECGHLVQQVLGQPFVVDTFHLQALPLGLLVQRLLTNLKGVYLRTEDYSRAVRTIERLRQLAPGDVGQQRDLGAVLLRTEQPGRAIDHLRAYLAAAPESDDAAAVREMLEQARTAVARWN
jgi:regulator of sirC expression with transglutaminase-like and TPR domain